MNSKLVEKLAHTILYFGFVVGVVAVYAARASSHGQLLIVIILVAYYLIWGFSYHSAKKDLSAGLAVEYLIISLIALLAAFIIFAS